MIVYRVCTQEELDRILSGVDYCEIGNKFSVNSTISLNTHDYDIDYNYLHFFDELGNIIFLGALKNNYVCYYDIPDDLLEKSKGLGFYQDPEFFFIDAKVPEYAIQSRFIKRNYLIGVDLIKEEMDLGDYLDDPSLGSFLEHKYLKGIDNELVKVIK